MKKIEIGYEVGSSKTTMSEEYDQDGPYSKAFILHSSTGFVAKEDGVLKASICMDDVLETFELENEK